MVVPAGIEPPCEPGKGAPGLVGPGLRLSLMGFVAGPAVDGPAKFSDQSFQERVLPIHLVAVRPPAQFKSPNDGDRHQRNRRQQILPAETN